MAYRVDVPRYAGRLALGFVLWGAACGSSENGPNLGLVGAACIDDTQCASWCVHERHYPGGMCSVHCNTDLDCPTQTICVEDAGGLCALPCGSDEACQALGRGYVCDGTSHKGSPGMLFVCRGP